MNNRDEIITIPHISAKAMTYEELAKRVHKDKHDNYEIEFKKLADSYRLPGIGKSYSYARWYVIAYKDVIIREYLAKDDGLSERLKLLGEILRIYSYDEAKCFSWHSNYASLRDSYYEILERNPEKVYMTCGEFNKHFEKLMLVPEVNPVSFIDGNIDDYIQGYDSLHKKESNRNDYRVILKTISDFEEKEIYIGDYNILYSKADFEVFYKTIFRIANEEIEEIGLTDVPWKITAGNFTPGIGASFEKNKSGSSVLLSVKKASM